MKNIKLLECTLRDGGRLFNCAFLDNDIRDIATRLTAAKIDFVEMGFIRDNRKIQYNGDSTFFTSVSQISQFIPKNKNNTLFCAFIDFGMCNIDELESYDGTSIDAIRLGFTKKDYINKKEELLRWVNIIKSKGYKLFIQGVNSLNYSDKELLELVSLINSIKPYSFGIVDTYGAMYNDDIDRIFSLVDHNLDQDICVNFHSHNNYQLSFALAQEIIKLSQNSNRNIIIDSTLGGIGKVAGNLNSELITDFLVRKFHYDYEFEDLLDLIDDYIYPYSLKYKWGYSPASLLSGIYKSHPNNVIYLTEKFRLDTKDIGNLLSMIDPETRQKYDYDNIEKLYTEYIADKVDDEKAIILLKSFMENKEILVLVPGSTLNTYHDEILNYITTNNPIIISINFISEFKNAYAFFSNQKRYSRLSEEIKNKNIIISSNIKSTSKEEILVNYHKLINRGYKYFENATIMLLNLLRRINPKKITLAGFDGFDENVSNNYIDRSFQNERHISEFKKLNEELSEMFNNIKERMEPNCSFKFITPSKFQPSKNDKL